jgi:hypothetical protein
MQFSAFRQRVFTGYDPVVRDSTGNPVWQVAEDGVTPLLDSQGLQIPVVRSPGRIGVDRALVFPGEATKVFDLPESNLSNYITVLGEFLTDLFAVAQVPPQYLLNRMANLSGDALAGAESTLQSLVNDLQRWTGESLEQVMRLANRARGTDEPDLASEVVWADAEARSFAADHRRHHEADLRRLPAPRRVRDDPERDTAEGRPVDEADGGGAGARRGERPDRGGSERLPPDAAAVAG